MTKKEQREMDELRRQLAEAKAWRRTEPVERDIQIPEWGQTSRGFLAIGSVSVHGGVCHAASRSGSHYKADEARRVDDWINSDRGGSQDGIRLYSKRSMALRAMRWMIEEDVAFELAKMDRRIAEAEAEEANG